MIGNSLLSIKDFSKLTGIKQSTLRYYDDLGLFSPAKRGENNYRYYQPFQIITINSINLLHELNLSIRTISELSKNRTPESVLEVLSAKEQELDQLLFNIERSYNVIRTYRQLIHQGLAANESAIEVRFLDELPIIIGDENNFNGSAFFYDAFLKFCSTAKQYRIDLRFPVGGLFRDFDSFMENPGEPTNFFSVDPEGINKRPAGKFLVGYTRGYYGQTNTLSDRIKKYVTKNKLTPAGPVYNIFLIDELCEKNQDSYLMQFTMRVE